ncbi:transferase family-domain-containing protein [Aspergillus avenaceus]|uniref:Transferase family-domain-containing protein n=1 Tax=Aspergillus avenaceus TaxID=36643 RepID=A0A5N6U973_ASPAV|nr:transferase family-domain-containing protein [Aspergillus avenaceus]
MDALDVELDILGQTAGLRIYTQICLCYRLPNETTHGNIIDTLEQGLSRLSATFPWLAGQVITEGNGIPKIKQYKEIPDLVIKDMRHDRTAPSMGDLRGARFPFSMLDESVIAPRTTLPSASDGPVSPVLLVQANFINGGLILTIVAHHSAMDMTGQGQVMHLFSKACRNEPFTDAEIETGNLAGRNITPLLDEPYQPGQELDRVILDPNFNETKQSIPPECKWKYFSFPGAALAKLKALAMESKTTDYISTDDALTAFLWQSVLRARSPRLSQSDNTTLGRAVDTRRHLGIPQIYTGLIQHMDYHTTTLASLLQTPLGEIASDLRRGVDPRTSRLAFAARALATHIRNTRDRSLISFGAKHNPSTDLMLSSWANVPGYGLDFGLGLGEPEAVRRPQFAPVEGLVYFMPRRPDGEIVVGVSLSVDDMWRFVADEGVRRFAVY